MSFDVFFDEQSSLTVILNLSSFYLSDFSECAMRYSGNGPSNPMHLDDYHKKVVEKITSNEDNRNAPMVTLQFIS